MMRVWCVLCFVCGLCACTSVKDVSLGSDAKNDDRNQTGADDHDAAIDAASQQDAGEHEDHHDDDDERNEPWEKSAAG